MTQETITPGSWRIHLLVTGGVLFTVLLALLLAQLDSLQRQILPSPVAQAIANLNATPTNTLLPAIPLATGTPTPPASGTPTNANTDTAVAVLPGCGSMPPDWELTPVAPGDTLLTLSVRYNISEEKIRLANCLAPGSLVNATALYLPSTAATPGPVVACGPPQDWVLYTVLRGENMFRLSLRHGTTINAILNANCLTSTSIQAEQKLYLPPRVVIPPTPRATATATSTATATTTPTATITHTPTSTVPPLPTSSVTATSTATGTATATGTPTTTATASITPTASVTTTVTTTPSASPTASPTPSGTPSSTPTPTSSATPTVTATPSPTNSPTPSSTPTTTATPTATATATATETAVP